MFIERKSVQQVATLPFIETKTSVDVLLISSRRQKRWIVPKGWPTRGLSFPEAAAREAEEEAGVTGPVHPEPIGSYLYRKRMDAGYDVPCHVFVYPMMVVEHRLDWPERGERTLKWCALGEAARLVDDADLREMLGALAAQGGAPLLDMAGRFPAHAA